MANNRYYIHCECGSNKYLGKSMGDGLYVKNDDKAAFLEGVWEWMWDHLTDCDICSAVDPVDAMPEYRMGEIFKIITEYDDRVTAESIVP